MATEIKPDLHAGLPIVAYADRWRHRRRIAMYAYLTAVGALMLFCAVVVPFVDVPLFLKLMSPIMLVFSIPWLGWMLPMALTLTSDLRVRGPVLTIDKHGFVDRRSGVSIAWSEIRSIRLIECPPGVNSELFPGVTIRLKDEAKLPRRTWKRRIMPLLTKSDEFHCSLALLTERADPLAWKMKDLVKQAGGTFWNPREPYPLWKAAINLYIDIVNGFVISRSGRLK